MTNIKCNITCDRKHSAPRTDKQQKQNKMEWAVDFCDDLDIFLKYKTKTNQKVLSDSSALYLISNFALEISKDF